jgi:hypothetical protein
MNTRDYGEELDKLHKQLQDFERRFSRLEERLKTDRAPKVTTDSRSETDSDIEIRLPFQSKGSIEFGIGEYGMAWLGNIVLFIGITFLVQNFYSSGNFILSCFIGYTSVAAIYAGAYFSQKAYSYLSRLLFYNAHLILFIITLRLHYFQIDPFLKEPFAVLVIISAILLAFLLIAIRKKSQFQLGFVLLMCLIAGIVSNQTHYLLAVSVLVSAQTLYSYYKFGWIKIVMLFITLTYFVHLLWLLNNPLMTNVAEFRSVNNSGLIYLAVNALLYSLIVILPKMEKLSDDWLIVAIIWNGLGFTSVLVLTVLNYYTEHYVLIFGVIMLFSLSYAAIIKKRSGFMLAASIYAIYGFVAMSIALYGIFLIPKAYMLLAIQSFLVVSVALWFRSRFLVITNTLLFILLLSLYLKDPTNYISTDFAFMLVAFISARVMNWKKDRLKLQTDFIRNLYLLAGFVMTLIAFKHLMPESLVTASWIGAAVLFFLLSILIKNKKYRWLAIATLIASAVNLIFIDMSRMSINLRILIFLIVAVISISVSVLYTRYFIHKKEN